MAYRCARCHSRLRPSRDPKAYTLCKYGGVIEEGKFLPAFWDETVYAANTEFVLRLVADDDLPEHGHRWLEARENHLAQMRKSSIG